MGPIQVFLSTRMLQFKEIGFLGFQVLYGLFAFRGLREEDRCYSASDRYLAYSPR